MSYACRWCGDPSFACEQVNGSCGWLLVAEDTFSAEVLCTQIQKSAACVLLRAACDKHLGLITLMVNRPRHE